MGGGPNRSAMTEGRTTRAGGEQGEWRWEVYAPKELPGALLDLPGDVRAEMESQPQLGFVTKVRPELHNYLV